MILRRLSDAERKRLAPLLEKLLHESSTTDSEVA
jgi:hypothetical protein